MNKATIVGKSGVARIEHVPRISIIKRKVKPFDNNEHYHSTTNTNTIIRESLRSVSPECISIQQSTLRSSDYNSDQLKTEKLSSSDIPESSLSPTNNKINIIKQTKNCGHRFINWFNLLTFKQKILFGLIIAIIIISILVVTIIPPIYIFVIRQTHSESSFTNITVSSCSTSTCIGKETAYRTSIVTALYPFDGNTNDQTGYSTGMAFGTSTPSFTSGAYVGQTINLNPTVQQQYVQIPSISLSKQSFTLQAWLYPGSTNTSGDFGIFSQCDSSWICLSLNLRSTRFVFSFDFMNATNKTLIGSSSVTLTEWVHVTVVYDAILFQQQIYVDGQIDAVSSAMINSYQGDSSSSTTTIGRSSSFGRGTSYFQGKIDHFTISAGVARSACQIYNDASLIAYYPFDTTGIYNDYSVYLCNGIASGTTAVSSGRVNQAISFTSSTSYFQSQCFPKMRASDQSFSFSLWINPTSMTGGGTLVHLSSNLYGNGSTCYDPLVFTSSGALVSQWITTGPTSVSNVEGPVISANTWTHIAVVYGSTNGVRLFINGQFSTSSPNAGSLNLADPNNPWYITLGNKSPLGSSASVNCLSGSISISSGGFSGSIDEFRLYNRELNNQEICVLANP
ncbi:unnamed protein product [Rotaria sp. Silwood2]|nr:unnamed protein product [Rotaria sp. Silwood2]